MLKGSEIGYLRGLKLFCQKYKRLYLFGYPTGDLKHVRRSVKLTWIPCADLEVLTAKSLLEFLVKTVLPFIEKYALLRIAVSY